MGSEPVWGSFFGPIRPVVAKGVSADAEAVRRALAAAVASEAELKAQKSRAKEGRNAEPATAQKSHGTKPGETSSGGSRPPPRTADEEEKLQRMKRLQENRDYSSLFARPAAGSKPGSKPGSGPSTSTGSKAGGGPGTAASSSTSGVPWSKSADASSGSSLGFGGNGRPGPAHSDRARFSAGAAAPRQAQSSRPAQGAFEPPRPSPGVSQGAPVQRRSLTPPGRSSAGGPSTQMQHAKLPGKGAASGARNGALAGDHQGKRETWLQSRDGGPPGGHWLPGDHQSKRETWLQSRDGGPPGRNWLPGDSQGRLHRGPGQDAGGTLGAHRGLPGGPASMAGASRGGGQGPARVGLAGPQRPGASGAYPGAGGSRGGVPGIHTQGRAAGGSAGGAQRPAGGIPMKYVSSGGARGAVGSGRGAGQGGMGRPNANGHGYAHVNGYARGAPGPSGVKRRRVEEEEDDNDSFIDDEEYEERGALPSSLLNMFRRNRGSHRPELEDSDDECMEATLDEVWQEEQRSARIAREEDRRELALIEQEEREAERRRQEKLKRKHKG